MFTIENTDGFTAQELEILNAALEIRMARGEGKTAAHDAINNAWVSGATVADLI